MKPDLIAQYCIFCDYPLFRENLIKYRDRFNKIILYPSRHHGKIDLEHFAQKAIQEAWVKDHAIDWTTPNIDWRQAEVEPCLKFVESDWIFFTEQDFFCKDWGKLFDDVDKASKTADMIGWWNPTHFPYVHPSCLFIKKEMFDKTKKDFRAHSEINGADHFSMITKEVWDLGGKIKTLQSLGYEEWKDAFHLGGLTYVYQDWKGDGTDHFGVKNLEAFYVYNHLIREAKVEQNVSFLALSREIETSLRQRFPELIDIDFENNKWREFFI